jgi:hypothetical protein
LLCTAFPPSIHDTGVLFSTSIHAGIISRTLSPVETLAMHRACLFSGVQTRGCSAEILAWLQGAGGGERIQQDSALRHARANRRRAGVRRALAPSAPLRHPQPVMHGEGPQGSRAVCPAGGTTHPSRMQRECAESARLLPRGAAPAHVQLGAAGKHDDAVVVAARRAALLVRLDLDVVDVLRAGAATCLIPWNESLSVSCAQVQPCASLDQGTPFNVPQCAAKYLISG